MLINKPKKKYEFLIAAVFTYQYIRSHTAEFV